MLFIWPGIATVTVIKIDDNVTHTHTHTFHNIFMLANVAQCTRLDRGGKTLCRVDRLCAIYIGWKQNRFGACS